MPEPRVFPTVYYRDKRAALDWLSNAFGFETSMVVTNADGLLGHCEMTFAGAVINIESEWTDWTRSPASLDGANTHSIGFHVDDVDSHHARAVAAGARILSPLTDQFYGWRSYVALDPEGHAWRFSRVVRRMSHEEMEAASGGRKVRSSP
jgi:uncharacterized glyoxalase superfamily protein PhnB